MQNSRILLLVAGPPGVGKSTVMRYAAELEPLLRTPKGFVARPLREGGV